MPPHLDIYAMSQLKVEAVIQDFLREYIIYEENEDREDEEIMYIANPEEVIDYPESKLAVTLTNLIQKGMAIKNLGFTIYLKPADQKLESVILTFTYDDKVIFGLSMEDEGAKQSTFDECKLLLEKLMEDYNCFLGVIVSETPPPSSEAVFREYLNNPLTDFFVLNKPYAKYKLY